MPGRVVPFISPRQVEAAGPWLWNPYLDSHAHRVGHLCRGIAATLRLNGLEAGLIVTAARLHDIGKIGLPPALLSKEGPLTAAERRLIETHPERGALFLQRYGGFAEGASIIRHHHERWDGMGYPDGLMGEEIPLGARIIAVADSYDAMTTDRPYRRALSRSRAAAILASARGRQWDPAVVDAFLRGGILPRSRLQ